MKKSRFIYGSILIVIVNFIIRLISFCYDVILSKFIGAEGMGLFQMATSTLMVFLVISASGISTAVSRLVAEQNSKNNHYTTKMIVKIATLFTIVLSISLSFILISLGKTISMQMFKDKDMSILIYLLTPAIITISINSVIKGYYYGLKMIGVASVSEIVEHVTKFIIVLGFLNYVCPVEPKLGALIAICGISIGEIFDLIWLIFMYKHSNEKPPYIVPTEINKIEILTQILYIATPLTISSLINVLFQFLNTILIPNKLMASGFTNSEAIATFGRIKGMAMPLIFSPFIVTSALIITLIPSLSEQVVLKNYKNMKNDILLAIKTTLLMSIPLTALYAFFSQPLAIFLYDDPKVGEFIHIMSYGTVFVAINHTLSGILNGLSKQINVTINQLIGILLQLFCVYYLVDNPKFIINGFFIGFYLRILATSILNFFTLRKMIKMQVNYKDLLAKPLIATAFMVISIYISQYYIHVSNNLNFIYSLIVGALSYIFVLYITKAIPQNLLGKLFEK